MSFKVLSLFSGIGAFEKALKNIGVDYDLVGYSEIDKYASKSYAAIHNVDESMNLGDITKINEKELPKDIDLITYGYPCQDISLAGKQKGLFNEDGSKTRSGLFFDALRIIEEIQPRVAIAENVKNLVGKKFKPQFDIILDSLDKAGYNNYWQVLNAKDYGIPQNRERVFIVSIRKDVDNGFKFPKAVPLQLRLKDMLDDEVDEKFYLSKEQIDRINNSNFMQEKKRLQEKDYVDTLLARDYKDPKCVAHGTVTATIQNYRIRKLTPKECWKLMGFDDEDFEKAEKVNSNTQLYKQAGNSIVVDVLENIFIELFKQNIISI